MASDLPKISLAFNRQGEKFTVATNSFIPLVHAFNFLVKDHMPNDGSLDKETRNNLRKQVWNIGNSSLKMARVMYYRGELNSCIDILWCMASSVANITALKKAQKNLIHEMVRCTVFVIRRSVFLAPEDKEDDYFLEPCPARTEPSPFEEETSSGSTTFGPIASFFEPIWKELKKFCDAAGGHYELSKAAISSAKTITVEASQSSWLVKEDELANMYVQLHMTVLSNPWDPDVLGRVRGLRAMMGNAMEADLREYFCISEESILQDFEADMECQYQEFEGRDLLEYRLQMLKTAFQLCYDQDRKDQAQRYFDLATKNFSKALEKPDIAVLWSKIKSKVDDTSAQLPKVAASTSSTSLNSTPTASPEDERRAAELKVEGNEWMARCAEAVADAEKLQRETESGAEKLKSLAGQSKGSKQLMQNQRQQKELEEKVKVHAQTTKKHVTNWADKAVRCYTRALETCNVQDPTLRAILFNNRAFAQTYLEEHTIGLADALASIAANPRFVKAYYRGAICARNKKDYNYAVKLLRMGIIQEKEQNPDLPRKDSKLEQLMGEILRSDELKSSLTAGNAGSDPNGHTTISGETGAAGGSTTTTSSNGKQDSSSTSSKKGSTKSSSSKASNTLFREIPPAPYPKSLKGHLQCISILEDPLGLDLPREDISAEEHAKLMVRVAVALVMKRYFFDHGPEGYKQPDLETRIDGAKSALKQCKSMCGSTISKPQRKRLDKIIDQAIVNLALAMERNPSSTDSNAAEDGEKAMTWCQAYFQDCLFIPQEVVVNALKTQIAENKQILRAKKERNQAMEVQNKKDRKKLEDQAKALEKQKKSLADVQKREEDIDSQLREFLEAKSAAAGGDSILDSDPTVLAKREALAEIRESNAALEAETAAAEKDADVEVARLQLETAEMKERLKAAQVAHQTKLKTLAAKKAELVELRAQEAAAAQKEKEQKEAELRREKELQDAAAREEDERRAREKEEARAKRLEEKQKAVEVSALASESKVDAFEKSLYEHRDGLWICNACFRDFEYAEGLEDHKKAKKHSQNLVRWEQQQEALRTSSSKGKGGAKERHTSSAAASGSTSGGTSDTNSVKVTSIQDLQAKIASGKAQKETHGGYVDPFNNQPSIPTTSSVPSTVGLGVSPPTMVIPPAASDSIWTVSAPTANEQSEPSADLGGGFLVTSSDTTPTTAVMKATGKHSTDRPTLPPTSVNPRLNPTARTFEPKVGAVPFVPSAAANPWLPPSVGDVVPGGGATTLTPLGGGTKMTAPSFTPQNTATTAANPAGLPQPRSQQRNISQQQQPISVAYIPGNSASTTTSTLPTATTTTTQAPKQLPNPQAQLAAPRIRFFVQGNILSSVWDESIAQSMMDEFPNVEFDVHKARVGKKATIMVIAPTKTTLIEVVGSLSFFVADALFLEDEIYRELANGDAEVVGSLATSSGTTNQANTTTAPLAAASTIPPPSQDPFGGAAAQTFLPAGTGSSTTSTPASALAPNPFSKPPSGTSPTQATAPNFSSMWGTTTTATTTTPTGGTTSGNTTAGSLWGDVPLTGLAPSSSSNPQVIGGEKKAAADDLGGMLAFINE